MKQIVVTTQITRRVYEVETDNKAGLDVRTGFVDTDLLKGSKLIREAVEDENVIDWI